MRVRDKNQCYELLIQTFIFLFVFKLYSTVNEAPLVLDIHGAVIGHCYHLRHFCIIQNTTKVNLQLRKNKIKKQITLQECFQHYCTKQKTNYYESQLVGGCAVGHLHNAI